MDKKITFEHNGRPYYFIPAKSTSFEDGTRWNGHSNIGLNSGSEWIDETLWLTPAGRWILNRDETRYHAGPDHYAYITDDQARDWLIRSEINEEAITEHFGPLPDEPDDEMTGAEISAYRHLLGLSAPELAGLLDNAETSIRKREAGSKPIPPGVVREIRSLVGEHTALVQQMLDADGVVAIPAKGGGGRPRGWYVAAAARALALEPDLMIEWG